MLAYVLALAVGLGSLAIYLAAFFFPEIHRKNDFIWSGVGLFYALILWVFAQRINGGLLLGHVASVALLGWFGWQTLSLRRQVTPKLQQTPVPSSEAVKTSIQQQVTKLSLTDRLGQLQKGVSNTLTGVKDKLQKTPPKVPPKSTTTATSAASKVLPTVEIIDNTTAVTQNAVEEVATTTKLETTISEIPTEEVVTTTEAATTTETLPEVIPPNPPSPELVEAAQAHSEIEHKEPIPVEEIAPDAVLAPPAEAPPEQLPPHNTAS
ncbi:Ycf66 family protein [Tolypothrix sp. FACHB-123]|uniref:Ycf66 family protein n=1 Tax=Tolypothrix sp. FACHB-123 TaxID=2692868 RepID=UPI0016895615|nr:Ycf66 family protein [Tolypothrix sp. FACHB-123]MBD2357284.1 Ycf66 family protein [Tolypothrix sp. FACHB-123]